MRTWLVTGATSGIGLAVTRRLVARGDRVHAWGRDLTPLAALGPSPGVVAARVDVGRPEEIARACDRLAALDGIVASAGLCRTAALDDPLAADVWREVLAVNLDGVFHTLRHGAPRLADGGRIVVVSSGLGKLGRAGYGAYAASKHAVLGLVRCLSRELAARRVTVNAVCPGWVETPMAAADLERAAHEQGTTAEAVRAAATAGIALHRFVTADEVAALVDWLLSPAAAAITGESYNISGGEFFA